MKIIFLVMAMLFAGSSVRAQTVTLQRAKKSENLKTADSLAATKPCTGITEDLAVSDSTVAIARTPAAVSLNDTISVSDSLAIAFTFTFPLRCVLSFAGNVVTCTIAGLR